jgi:hypothetical protein
VIEKKLEKQRIERVQKWDELSRLYASTNETVPNSSERKQNGQREASYQNIFILSNSLSIREKSSKSSSTSLNFVLFKFIITACPGLKLTLSLPVSLLSI